MRPPRKSPTTLHALGRSSTLPAAPDQAVLDRVPLAAPKVIYDLGCGSGQVTRLMAERWPSATVYGLDNSPEMLERAAAEPGKVHWLAADIRTWSPAEPPDLLYANATLQWVEEHQALFPRLVGFLQAGGCLAVQMPLSWEAPSHRLMRETLANGGPHGNALGRGSGNICRRDRPGDGS